MDTRPDFFIVTTAGRGVPIFKRALDCGKYRKRGKKHEGYHIQSSAAYGVLRTCEIADRGPDPAKHSGRGNYAEFSLGAASTGRRDFNECDAHAYSDAKY